ncbi:hypothetical protein ADMFC3_10360 [Geovibrio sp. ADMFC3]
MKSYYMALPWIARNTSGIITETFKTIGKFSKLKKNTVVLSQERLFDKYVYVESGLLGQTTNDVSLKKPSIMGLIPPGRMFGPTPIARKAVSITNFYAMRESTVYIVRQDDLLRYMEDKPAVKEEFLLATISRLHTHIEKFAVAAMLTPKERLQLFFKVILISYEIDLAAKWLRLPVNLSIIEFSNIVYTTEQMLAKIFMQWKKDGLLKREGRYTIINKNLLETLDWSSNEVAFYDK